VGANNNFCVPQRSPDVEIRLLLDIISPVTPGYLKKTNKTWTDSFCFSVIKWITSAFRLIWTDRLLAASSASY
jgi:hypothetical protein